jgi:ABC-2 type transport system permease protein
MVSIWQSYWMSLQSMVRDRNVLLLLIIGPIVYSIYYPFPYSPEVLREVPVAVVDLDHSSLSRQLVRLADASPDIEVTRVLSSPAELEQAIWDGSVEGGLIIPHEFRRNVLRGVTVNPVVLGNGAYFMFNRAEILGFAGAVHALSSELGRRHQMAGPVSLVQASTRGAPVRLALRAASNPIGGYSTYVVPAVAVVVLQQTLLLGICMLLGTWRESGAPFDLKSRRNRLAVVLAAATICFANALYYVGLVYWREDYPHLGQLIDLLIVIAIFSLTTATWAVALGSFTRYREQAVIYLLPTTIPIIFLAGFAWPIELIPAPLLGLGFLVPSSAGIQAFLNVDQMGASLTQVLPELMSLTLLLVAAWILILTKKSWPTQHDSSDPS